MDILDYHSFFCVLLGDDKKQYGLSCSSDGILLLPGPFSVVRHIPSLGHIPRAVSDPPLLGHLYLLGDISLPGHIPLLGHLLPVVQILLLVQLC